MTQLPRDLRPVLQIAHIGAWNVATPEVLQQQRESLWHAAKDSTEETLAHDPTAVLALRDWLEGVTVRDLVGRKIPTWIAETSGRTLLGDQPSILYGRSLAKRTFAALFHARVLVSGPGEHNRPDALDHLATHAAAPPVCFRAPHGAWEVQMFAHEHSLGAINPSQRSSIADEYAPEAGVFSIGVLAAYQAPDTSVGHDSKLQLYSTETSRAQAIQHTVARGDEQSIALLRIYASISRAKLVLIERLVFVRPLRMGSFVLSEELSTEVVHTW